RYSRPRKESCRAVGKAFGSACESFRSLALQCPRASRADLDRAASDNAGGAAQSKLSAEVHPPTLANPAMPALGLAPVRLQENAGAVKHRRKSPGLRGDWWPGLPPKSDGAA